MAVMDCECCGSEMEHDCWIFYCELCDWNFAHPDREPVEIQFAAHITQIHGYTKNADGIWDAIK
jgi:hypothetical protein